jgi:hypothetical protein
MKNRQQEELGNAANQDHPTPKQVQMTILTELVLCSVNHLLDNREALLRTKLVF